MFMIATTPDHLCQHNRSSKHDSLELVHLINIYIKLKSLTEVSTPVKASYGVLWTSFMCFPPGKEVMFMTRT